MDRREFLSKSGLMMAGMGVSSIIHPSILKAINIKPAPGSTFYDAEHIVVLMQENRSFDHIFGALRGVRGFRDKYAFRKPDGKPTFFQTDSEGHTYAPFRLNIKNTKAAWMGSLPHVWNNQQQPLNGGRYDKWLPAKQSGNPAYKKMPLTLGHYQREDIPFYYQFADAFTVFDQYFCSSLTGTHPNRLFLWTGTVRPEKNGDTHPNLVNNTVGYRNMVYWKTFPEVLEDNGVSWKIYQNEIGLPQGLTGQPYTYLTNFGCNTMEYFSQYGVKFTPKYHNYCAKQIREIQEKLKKNPANKDWLQKELVYFQNDFRNFDEEQWKRVSAYEKRIRAKAFTINDKERDFWEVESLPSEGSEKLYMPKGDILFQFRKDVNEGKLPTVSWLVAPERFTDHPTSQWYGAWYISEVLNILTKNPEVWRKTIFILNYDENDGLFDHIVPFGPPDNPSQVPDVHGPQGIDYVDFRQQYFKTMNLLPSEKVEGAVGLGYRVPMIIASPWTTGGYVNSEVSDHTSVIQFLETFLSRKTGKELKIDNMSDWRREIVGNLTTAFRQDQRTPKLPIFLTEKGHIEAINSARLKPVPKDFHVLNDKEQTRSSRFFPRQESGIRPANPLDYYFEVNLLADKIVMGNAKGKSTPLNVYNRKKMDSTEKFLFPYALYKGTSFAHPVVFDGGYDWEVFGPNGFYRNFLGPQQPVIEVTFRALANGDAELGFTTFGKRGQLVFLENLYEKTKWQREINDGEKLIIPSGKLGGWYDFRVVNNKALWLFAGRIETGKVSSSDPHWALS